MTAPYFFFFLSLSIEFLLLAFGIGWINVWSTFLKIHIVGASSVTFWCLTVLEREYI